MNAMMEHRLIVCYNHGLKAGTRALTPLLSRSFVIRSFDTVIPWESVF